MKKCKFCGNDFNTKNKNMIYCSKKCKNSMYGSIISKKPPTKECGLCGVIFKPYNSLDKFCSALCRINNEKSKRSYRHTQETCDNRTGEKNPAFRNGLYTRKSKKTADGLRLFARNAKEIQQAIINEFGYLKCQKCDTSNSFKFESHHIIFRSEKRGHQNLHDKENILICCIKCHNEFHKFKPLRNQLVLDRKLNEIFGDDVLDKGHL